MNELALTGAQLQILAPHHNARFVVANVVATGRETRGGAEDFWVSSLRMWAERDCLASVCGEGRGRAGRGRGALGEREGAIMPKAQVKTKYDTAANGHGHGGVPRGQLETESLLRGQHLRAGVRGQPTWRFIRSREARRLHDRLRPAIRGGAPNLNPSVVATDSASSANFLGFQWNP